MFPIHLCIQELNFYRNFNNKIQIATEMTCFELIYHMKSESFSRGVLQEGSNHMALFESGIDQILGEEISISNLNVSLNLNEDYVSYEVSFVFPYTTRFIFKNLVTKIVTVNLAYDLPLDK